MDDVIMMIGYCAIGFAAIALLWNVIEILGGVIAALTGSAFGLFLLVVIVLVIIKKVL